MAVPGIDEEEDDNPPRPASGVEAPATADWPLTRSNTHPEAATAGGPPARAAGAVFAGRFVLERQVGAGGMGAVYRAVDRESGAPVAVKLLLGRSPTDVARFLREARVLSEIEDDAVVRYVAHGRAPEPYLVMEWLDGHDLGDHLKGARPTVGETVALARRVAGALAAVHARGVVHRDLKPRNLFLVGGRMDQVKITDFGIARSSRATRGITVAGGTVGTPEYMAPEQVRASGSVDARADVFSLGVVLFECLTGQRPFSGDQLVTILAKLLYEPTPSIAALAPEVPEALEALVERMLCKDPAGRPADASALLAEIDGLDRATLRPRPSPGGRAALTAEENRLVSVLLVGAVEEDFGDDPPPEGTPATSEPPPDVRQAVAATATRHGGQVDWLRDGTLVVVFDAGGAGGVATDQAERAARAALAVRAFFPHHPLSLVMGWRRAGRPSPIGDLLRRAGALLAGPEGAVWIDDLSAGLLDLRFEVTAREAGLALAGPRAIADGVTRTVLGKAVPFVGREGELATLTGAFAAAADAGARAVLVVGEAGVGKSRLREELVKWVRLRGEPATIWIARGDGMRAAAPLGLLGELVREAAHLHAGERLAARRKKLLARVSSSVDGDAALRVAEFLGEVAFARFPSQGRVELRAARQDPMRMADQTRRAFVDFLAAECRRAPVLLVLEDLHWSDRATLDALDAALRLLKEEPLLVLGLGRPEVGALFPDLWQRRGVTRIHLGGLSRSASARLSRQLLGEGATGEVADRLWQRAAGNPFLLEELARARGEGGADDLPETALAMVQSRLLALDPEARRLLRAASVFGRTFSAGAVLALLGAETRAADVEARLADLEAREWIARRAEARWEGERAYVFGHDLLREAAYGMLTDEDRRLGNALAGAWLADHGEGDALVLAEYFERGGELGRAALAYHRAAQQAFARNDLDRAVACAERGLSCAAGEPTLDEAWRGRLHLLEAQVNRWRGRHRDALEMALLAVRALPDGSAPWWEAAALVATSATSVGDATELEAASSALLAADLGELPVPPTHGTAETGEERDDLATSCAISLARAAVATFQRGHAARGQEILARAELAARRCPDDPAAWACVEMARGVGALVEGDAGRYLGSMRAARERFVRAGDLRAACQQANNVGNAYLQIGGYAEAERTLRESIAEADRLGLTGERHSARVNLGLALGLQGRVAEGAAVEEEELALSQNPRFSLVARTYLARILLPVDPARAAREIQPVTEETAPPVHRCYGLAVLAAARLSQGDVDGAREAAGLAKDLLAALGEIEEGGPFIHLTWAEALAAAGDPEAARTAITAAETQLLAQAARIADPDLRRSFLDNVPENARTLDLAHAWGRAGEM